MGQQQLKDELLFQQVTHGDVEVIKSLHHEGAGLEWVDKEGRTPLIMACTKPELHDVAKTLLDLGSNANAYRSGRNAGTPLHHAANNGLENAVKLLLSHGANPLALNDDSNTPLDIARAKGYISVVRAIESHICLFSGWMREFYGPNFLELFVPQLLTKKVWVVVLPTGSRNPKPFTLVVYDSLQDAQPNIVMPLSKANLEAPETNHSDASVMIVDRSTSLRHKRQRRSGYISQARRWAQVDKLLKLAAATKGDLQQLNRFYEACTGIPQTTATSALKEEGSVKYSSVDMNHVKISLPSANYENKEGGFGVCVICVDASSEAVCVPCGHVAGCVSCLKQIKDKNFGCPVCRANIVQVIKLYHV